MRAGSQHPQYSGTPCEVQRVCLGVFAIEDETEKVINTQIEVQYEINGNHWGLDIYFRYGG